MFKKSKEMGKNKDADSQAYNRIDAGTVITGDIQTEGNIRIDGTLVGSVDAQGKVVIGETGSVEGEIRCQNADISGSVEAKVQVLELLALRASGRLVGEIETTQLSVEPGAILIGNTSMGAVIKDFKIGQETPELKEATA